MTEYIDKTKLINEGWELRRIYQQDEHTMVCETKKIADIPSADVVERKTGKWIEQEDGWGGYYYDCSVCNESWTTIDGTPWDNGMNFCPNCGAEMSCPQIEDN